jgi:hypothetical protein
MTMTEAEWLASECASDMLQYLRDSDRSPEKDASRGRKYRLFACACVRWVWERRPTLSDTDRAAVAVAERFADKQVAPTELQEARSSGAVGLARKTLLRSPRMAASDIARAMSDDSAVPTLLRDVIGNPFRPVTVDPAWLMSTVRALAAVIYADRAFDRLPILADAIEDAGCDSADILAHCRGDGPHVRGCWVVDLLLGKE